MKIETKFDLDQAVWTISDSAAYRIVKCMVCVAGKLTIGNEEFVCPKCEGKSAHPHYAGRKWHVSHQGVIGKIQTEQYGACAPSYARNNRITYMIDSTGVGSGQCWEEADLFATREDAQAECNKKNGLLNLTDEANMLEALI